MSTSNTTIRTITVTPGECFILPANANITSVIIDGTINFSSDGCPNIVNTLQSMQAARVCGALSILTANNSNNSHIPNVDRVYLQGIRVNGVNYPFFQEIEDSNTTLSDWQAVINSTSIGAAIVMEGIQRWLGSNRGDNLLIVLKCPQDFIDSDFFFYGRATTVEENEIESTVYFKVVDYADRPEPTNDKWTACS